MDNLPPAFGKACWRKRLGLGRIARSIDVPRRPIELLLVIAIIAILALLLLPALSKAKIKGQGVVCSGNLKQPEQVSRIRPSSTTPSRHCRTSEGALQKVRPAVTRGGAVALFLLQMNNNIISMKLPLIVLTLGTALNHLPAQEQLPREQALKYAYAVSVNLEQLQGTPIATDVDLKRPVVVRDGEYGGMFLPEAKLTAEAIPKAEDKVVPIGQLWLHKLTPMQDGQGIAAEKLRMAKVTSEDGTEVQVPQCALGMRRNAAGTLELLVYGKSTEPVLAVPMSPAEGKAAPGIALEAERGSEGGQVTVTFFGKYKAKLSFTELQQ